MKKLEGNWVVGVAGLCAERWRPCRVRAGPGAAPSGFRWRTPGDCLKGTVHLGYWRAAWKQMWQILERVLRSK